MESGGAVGVFFIEGKETHSLVIEFSERVISSSEPD